MNTSEINILGIESSCDETGVAIVSTTRGLLAHTLHSQIEMHRVYGGVVPELASRDHIRRIVPLIECCLKEANLTKSDLTAIAYTAGPGLNGALLVGSSVAQALAWSLKLPTIPIHHLEGHLLSPMLAEDVPEFPFVALLVSGGHTQLMRVDGVARYTLLGETLDDAAGEAFDKSAKLLGLSYPGGPELSRLAEQGDPNYFDFPRPMKYSSDFDFSFSGLKTSVLTLTKKIGDDIHDPQIKAHLAAGIQAAIVDVLAYKAIKAIKTTGLKRLVVAGGVGANRSLRQYLQTEMKKYHGEVFFPPLALCTDNGAMIAHAASERVKAGLCDLSHPAQGMGVVRPRWDLTKVCIS